MLTQHMIRCIAPNDAITKDSFWGLLVCTFCGIEGFEIRKLPKGSRLSLYDASLESTQGLDLESLTTQILHKFVLRSAYAQKVQILEVLFL
jgi:hypothetical protein